MKTYRIQPLPAPISAQVTIPGSKSYTNRALIMASLTRGRVTIANPLFSDDTEAMIECLTKLGLDIDVSKGQISINNDISTVTETSTDLNARDSGTTIRFVTALATLLTGETHIGGSQRLNERPIGELVDGLNQLGASITFDSITGYPPLLIQPAHLHPGTARLNGDVSSQFFSALLMIAPYIGDIKIEVIGNQISKPYIDMTIGMMADWGVLVANNAYQSYHVGAGQQYRMSDYTVEGDYSSAGYFFSIAALTKSTITLHNLNPQSHQADQSYLKILQQMGATIETTSHSVTIHGNGVIPLTVDMESCPDQVQTLAVLAAFAPGTTHISGVRSLRLKETERVVAIQTELNKMGIVTESTHDTLTIHGGSPRPAAIDTYGDHRMAMSFAVAGTMLSGMKINHPEVVHKTYPGFWETVTSLGVAINEE